ncbi:MAG: biopolymer transporter ExbD, partial [Bacteroidetes bacterium]|nr:biopolymer transporter ExbD [Bacteroidota bacterium]
MSRRLNRRRHPAVELNITAFMNLMVVLVPFLLITAVFTHVTVLDLNLPPPGAKEVKQPK